MRSKLFLLLLFISTLYYSQIKFEKGYFIDNENLRHEVLIRNVDWKNSPDSFDYKTDENDKTQTVTLQNAQEFAVYGATRFVRSTVKIDRSPINLNKLTTNKNPEYREETLFLKELVKGDISLFKYAEPNQNRYFFQNKTGSVEQLIYKPYLLNATDMVYNKEFINQIRQNLTCSSISENDVNMTEYKEKDLVTIFMKHNQCVNPENMQLTKETEKGEFNINIRPRINFSSLEFINDAIKFKQDLGSKTTFGIGVEFEYILPFNKKKWALILEPNYHYYQSESTQDIEGVSGGKLILSAKYSAIEIPIGFRHYMYINDDSKLFANIQFVTGIVVSSDYEMKRADQSVLNTFDSKVQPAAAFGLGYNYKNKYAAEIRMTTAHGVTAEYTYWSSSYKNLSLILSYNLF